MTAHDFGRSLLSKLEESSLQLPLNDLRLLFDAKKESLIGIHSIDRLLQLFAPPAARTVASTPASKHKNALSTSALLAPCIEIGSPKAGDGKTQLVQLLIAKAIVPPKLAGVPLGGHGKTVILIDAQGHLSIERLVKILRSDIEHSILMYRAGGLACDIPGEMVELTIRTALDHLHVYRPQSLSSLCATITHLECYLFDQQRHRSSHRQVHSIILDSATAFYWPDRNEGEMANVLDPRHSKDMNVRSSYTDLLQLLRHASVQFSCPIVYTTSNLFHKVPAGPCRSLPPSLPRSWTTMPTLKLIVQRRLVRSFPPAISAEEAARDASDRNKVVSQGWFDVYVNECDSEEWPSEVKVELGRAGASHFALQVTDEAIVVTDAHHSRRE